MCAGMKPNVLAAHPAVGLLISWHVLHAEEARGDSWVILGRAWAHLCVKSVGSTQEGPKAGMALMCMHCPRHWAINIPLQVTVQRQVCNSEHGMPKLEHGMP